MLSIRVPFLAVGRRLRFSSPSLASIATAEDVPGSKSLFYSSSSSISWRSASDSSNNYNNGRGGGGAGRVRSLSVSDSSNSGAATDDDDDGSIGNANVKSDFMTGTVKFYIRSKNYGFIIPDEGKEETGTKDVWVHRSSFNTPHSVEEYPSRPYLHKDERVKFQVEPVSGRSANLKAINLVFEDGRQVPLFRENYRNNVVKGEYFRLGTIVAGIVEAAEENGGGDHGPDDDAKRYAQIKDAVAKAKVAIQAAHAKQEAVSGGDTTE